MAVSSDTAVLRVAVTTALGAQPLENALVTVSTAPDERGSRQLLYSVRTDSGGMTPPMTFSTPPRENSLSPDGGVPYALYTVETALDGYVPLTALHIALFSGVPAPAPRRAHAAARIREHRACRADLGWADAGAEQ